ncbi:cytochrome c-type biogenesis protein CcmH, partial [Escherichia coli]|nr:cytochrome c-type biogenesis protein CcmH [Escherichia coli]
VQKLGEELRCLVCQNQNIADSHADLALDLKKQLREQIAAGRTDDEIKTYMVERYGDFVLYRPPLKATTVLLWAGPFVLLGAVAFALLRRL